MSTIPHRRRKYTLLSLGIGVLLANHGAYADSLTLHGDVQQTTSEEHSTHSARQRYQVNYNASRDLTDAMRINGSFRYHTDRSRGSWTSIISPAVGSSLDNDLFHLDVRGAMSRQHRTDASDWQRYSLDAGIASAWRNPLLPHLRLYINRHAARELASQPTTDTVTTQNGATISWQNRTLSANYSYSRNETESQTTGTVQVTENHNATIDGNRRWWNDRIAIQLSQQISNSHVRINTPVDNSGMATILVPVSRAYAGNNAAPALPSPLPAITAGLHDGVTDLPAWTIDPSAAASNLIVQVNFITVNALELYTPTDIGTAANAFQWDIYTSNDGTNWLLSNSGAPFSYSGGSRRFVIDSGTLNAAYIKLVASATPGSNQLISELRPIQRQHSSAAVAHIGSRTTDLASNASLTLRPRPDLTFTYNANYGHTRTSYGSNNRRYSLGGFMNWQARDNLAVRLHSNATVDNTTGQEENRNRSYSSTISYQPLATVAIDGQLRLNDSYQGNRHERRSRYCSTSIYSRIYRDLSARTVLRYSDQEAIPSGRRDSIVNGDILLSARLFPTIYAELTGGFNRDSHAGATGYSLAGTLSWRPSDMLRLQCNGSHSWTGDNVNRQLSVQADISAVRQLFTGLRYSVSQQTSTRQTSSLYLRWNISPFLSLYGDGNYAVDDDGASWSITTRVEADYSVL